MFGFLKIKCQPHQVKPCNVQRYHWEIIIISRYLHNSKVFRLRILGNSDWNQFIIFPSCTFNGVWNARKIRVYARRCLRAANWFQAVWSWPFGTELCARRHLLRNIISAAHVRLYQTVVPLPSLPPARTRGYLMHPVNAAHKHRKSRSLLKKFRLRHCSDVHYNISHAFKTTTIFSNERRTRCIDVSIAR